MNCGSDAVTSLRSIAFNLYKSELSVPSIQISIGKTKQTLIIEQYYRWKKEEEKKDNEARNKDQDDTKSIGPFISLVFFFLLRLLNNYGHGRVHSDEVILNLEI